MQPNDRPDGEFLAEGLRIIAEAKMAGIPLRLLGSVAIRLHSPEAVKALGDVARPLTDLDFITYGRMSAKVEKLLRGLGYEPGAGVAHLGRTRQIWEHPESRLHVDIFFDELRFCHAISFGETLEFDEFTITVSDLLLEKLQIVEINEKDLKDVCMLLRDHAVADRPGDHVDSSRLQSVLCRDWGFSHTFLNNLEKLKTFAVQWSVLAADRNTVVSRIDEIAETVNSAPKTLVWKARSVVGTRVRWYSEVEEVVR